MRQSDNDTRGHEDRRTARLGTREYRPPVARPTARRTHSGRGRPRARLSRQAQRHIDTRAASRASSATRPGDAIVVVGIDRLGRNAAEVMTTIRELRDREIALRSLREGIDTSNATGRMVPGALANPAGVLVDIGPQPPPAAQGPQPGRAQANFSPNV